MKLIIKKLVVLFLLSANVFASSSTGNGGIGVEVDGELYLLDLVEAQVHKTPHFKADEKISDSVVREIEFHLNVHNQVAKKIAMKLSEIHSFNPYFEYLLRKTLFDLDWRYIPHRLLPTTDHGDDVIDLNQLEGKTQIAVRIGSTVSISIDNFSKLDYNNKAALVLHEIIYTQTIRHKARKVAYNARYLTGLVFSKKMTVLSERKFNQSLSRHGLLNTKGSTKLNDNISFLVRTAKSPLHDAKVVLKLLSVNDTDFGKCLFEEVGSSQTMHLKSHKPDDSYSDPNDSRRYNAGYYDEVAKKLFTENSCKDFLDEVKNGTSIYTFYTRNFLFLK